MRRGSQGVESVHRSRQGAGRIVSLSVLFALIDGALGMCSQFQTGKLHRVTTALAHPHTYNRRHAVSGGLGVATAVGFGMLPFEARAGDEEYKDLSTKLSSKLLTSAETASESRDALGDINWGAPKVTGLSTEEMAKRLDAGLRRECWFVTGRSLPELFSDSFTFSDPQVSLTGIEEYSRGVRSFYKQGTAVGEIVCTAATAPDTITVVWRNYGTVNIGPGFDLAPYLVTTTLKTSASDGGLIVKQEDAFEVNNADLIKYNLFKASRPPVPPIESVACPLPKKA